MLALSYIGAWACALLLLGSAYGSIAAIFHGLIMIITLNFHYLTPLFITDSKAFDDVFFFKKSRNWNLDIG